MTIEATALDYKVADISLAEWGRKEIDIAEKEDARPDGHPTKITKARNPLQAQGFQVRCT